LSFLSENIGTIAVLAVLGLIVGLVIANMVKKKKRGGCGCGCTDCPMSGKCHKQ